MENLAFPVVPDPSLGPYLQARLQRIQSLFSVPVLYKGDIVGAVDLMELREALGEKHFRDYLAITRGLKELSEG